MADSTIVSRIADAASALVYRDLERLEDLDAFEALLAAGSRAVAAATLGRCIERFDRELAANAPRGWSAHDRCPRTLTTLLGAVTFTRTVFLDEHGRRRALADELLGIPPRSRLSACAFLWIATRAAELSYRKTAAEFEELTSVPISHVTVMGVVHAEGALLRSSGAEHARGPGGRTSQDTLFLEADGLWVHLQEAAHREHALPRFLYEQARETRSFELKIAALYAGKRRVAPGRYERGGLCLTCLDDGPDVFWGRAWSMLCENYVPEDVRRVAMGADGAEWCGPARVEGMAPEGCSVDFTLDFFHVMEKIAAAFPEGPKRDWAVNLAVRGKGKSLERMCGRVAERTPDAAARRRVRELGAYVGGHADAVRPPSRELGTMEGTNAHVGAARLKGQGRSWSRRGAEAMCLIRCALATGRPLVPPAKRAFFTERERLAAQRHLAKSASEVPAAVGRGWLPPHQASTGAMKTAVGFRARTC